MAGGPKANEENIKYAPLVANMVIPLVNFTIEYKKLNTIWCR